MALTKHTWLYSDLLRVLRENIRQLCVFNGGDLNISASAVPNNKDTFKTKRNDSYNILNCSNNKTIYGNGLFCHNK